MFCPESLPLTFILSPLKQGEGKGEGFRCILSRRDSVWHSMLPCPFL